MVLRVFDDRRRRIKTHRLVVEQSGRKCGQVVALQKSAGVSDQREAGGMGFGKPVEREGRDRKNNFLLRLGRNPVVRHTGAQFGLDLFHAGLRSLEAHGAAQFFRLAAGEVGRNHGQAKQLLLKKRYAQRALEHGFERRMRIRNFFAPLAALQKRIHHLADDGSRPDDRHLHHNVIKTFRPQARQARHLRPAFHLKQPDRVRLLQRRIDRGIILRKMRQIDFLAIVVANQFDRIFEHSHHSQAEQIDFDDAHVGAIFFVPLHDDAAGHGCGFEGDDGIELSLADDHAAGMLAEMPRHILHGQA